MPSLPELDALLSLPLRSQIAQMIVVRASGYLYDHQIQYPQWEIPAQALHKLISDGVGGVILVGGSAPEIYLRTQALQAQASIPLLIAADVEEGVGQRFNGATYFPPPMSLGAIAQEFGKEIGNKYAEAMGAITAQESLAIGLNWVLAPIVDINNNPANPVINVRAFGQEPEQVINLTTAFINGVSHYPVLTTAKHFPGHGDTAVDSHLQTPVLAHSRDRFDQIELQPFQAAIKAGVDTVMSAHVFAPSLDANTISTLSHPTLTGLLRQELGFTGLIVTDALIMAGVSDRHSPEEVAVQAILAGADILLMPVDAERTINAIMQAVESGKITRARIKESLGRVWKAKAKIFNSDFRPSLEDIGSAASLKIAAEITTKSIKVHLPNSRPLQIRTNLILVDDVLSCGEFLDSQTIKKIPDHIIADAHSIATICQGLDQTTPTLVQIFSRGNPFRGNAGIYAQIESLIKQLISHNQLKAIALYGSPYNLDRLIPLLTPNIAWAFSYSQQAIAQQEIMQRLGINSLN
ncbi:beta-glucosidase-like glycosyl hydrolase [Synechococcus sp. PCC 7502]|uniref:glycoside hydrolase family 3 N-terminal domain-containing protein n=1 Tax=Synechococcus sp. PCC 7502 TaxID=1173263 RepID=UPI00029FC39C|nr:glycoside hydrolase family 3 N-terminal domain-containing protein [Synechococcus sp. PCC 7502]AFY74169.1 beta-glucosidase-like glycosyl hydrolase [Synechococcus sp. PCC 7502]